MFGNGDEPSTITSSDSTLGYQDFSLYTDETENIKFCLDDPRWYTDVWLRITMVRYGGIKRILCCKLPEKCWLSCPQQLWYGVMVGNTLSVCRNILNNVHGISLSGIWTLYCFRLLRSTEILPEMYSFNVHSSTAVPTFALLQRFVHHSNFYVGPHGLPKCNSWPFVRTYYGSTTSKLQPGSQ